jgi:DNA-binding Xre family transcriptional regulator
MSSIRWRLREIAEPERWNPNKLAETTGLAYHTVWAIWHNKAKRADLATLATLATVLKIAPGNLIAMETTGDHINRHTG